MKKIERLKHAFILICFIFVVNTNIESNNLSFFYLIKTSGFFYILTSFWIGFTHSLVLKRKEESNVHSQLLLTDNATVLSYTLTSPKLGKNPFITQTTDRSDVNVYNRSFQPLKKLVYKLRI